MIENRKSIRATIAEMRRLTTISLLLACAFPAFGDETDDVRCREIEFSKAAEARDANTFRSFIDADARFVSNTVLRGPDAIAEAWSVYLTEGGPAIKWRPQIVEVLGDGKLALSRGPYRIIATDESGEPKAYWGTFNSVWRLNNDGQWYVVFDAGSPATDAPDESTRDLLDAEDNCP